ncbi:hypothetical protein VP01_3467g2 [Puccinia sorghi]|uniref:Uncharacterized protein n=1 Tax=Puccinia sorghi TaxID=27349 RepID=A0A0L6UW26_9BASI|nr:hypothetical protein VP01_3467g2 [Puccinia sorghi]
MGSSFGINSVSLYSPPSSIKFVSLNSKKRKTNHPSGSNNMAQLLACLLGQKGEGSSPTQSESNQSSTKQLAIIEILDHNYISSYKIFQSKSISQAQMSQWGLSDGIISKLRDNVRKYEKHSINH